MDKTLGENFIPDSQQLQVELFDASNFCSFSTVRPKDSMLTSYYPYGNFLRGVLGVANDPRLGKTQAGFALTFVPQEYGFDFGDTVAGFDSVCLVLDVSEAGYGSKTANMQVEVYALTQNLADSAKFYGTRSFDKSTSGFNIDSIIGTENLVVSGGALAYDTTKLSIRLNDNLLEKLWRNMSAADTFAVAFKGLYITVKNENDGCIKYAGAGQTSLTAYYHPTDSTTRSFLYGVSGQNFNYFQHDYKAEFAQTGNNDVLAMQGLCGVATELRFDTAAIRSWANERNIAVSRAELVLPVEDSENYSAVDAYSTTMKCVELGTSSYGYITDFSISSRSTFGGALNRSQMQYAINITHAFSEALPKKINDSERAGVSKPILITPYAFTYTSDSNGNAVEVEQEDARSIFISNRAGKKPQVKIWYSEVK
jgi:hypothetical protein